MDGDEIEMGFLEGRAGSVGPYPCPKLHQRTEHAVMVIVPLGLLSEDGEDITMRNARPRSRWTALDSD